jgi:hypothetical protein
MAFKVKDLLITVVPSEGGRAAPGTPVGQDCIFTIRCTAHLFLSGQCTATPLLILTQLLCAADLSAMRPVPVPSGGDPWISLEELAALKAQLRQALLQVESQEKSLEEKSRPQTVAQIEELEEKIREALGELERRKSDLKGK